MSKHRIHDSSQLLKKSGLQRCTGCLLAYYCNRECQRESWDIHKYECKNLKKIFPLRPTDAARLMSRVIFRLQNGGDLISGKVTESNSRKFKDLMNHYKDLKEDKKRQEHFVMLVEILKKFLGEYNLPNLADLMGIYGRICVNSFSICNSNQIIVGTGIYLAGSVFDHSCRPNAFATFIGTKLVVRSLVDWPELDFKKVRISYIDVMNTNEDRVRELHENYYFLCDCPDCHDENRGKKMSSINCGNKSCYCPVPISESDSNDVPVSPCPDCGFADFSSDTRAAYCQIAKYTRVQLIEMNDKCYIDICRKLFEMQRDLFHKINILRVKTLDAVFEATIQMGLWEEALKFGNENIEGLKFYYGDHHPMYSMVVLKIAKINLYLGFIQEAVKLLEEAQTILKVSHGCSHPLYTEDLMPLLTQAKNEMRLSQAEKPRIKKIVAPKSSVW